MEWPTWWAGNKIFALKAMRCHFYFIITNAHHFIYNWNTKCQNQTSHRRGQRIPVGRPIFSICFNSWLSLNLIKTNLRLIRRNILIESNPKAEAAFKFILIRAPAMIYSKWFKESSEAAFQSILIQAFIPIFDQKNLWFIWHKFLVYHNRWYNIII